MHSAHILHSILISPYKCGADICEVIVLRAAVSNFLCDVKSIALLESQCRHKASIQLAMSIGGMGRSAFDKIYLKVAHFCYQQKSTMASRFYFQQNQQQEQ